MNFSNMSPSHGLQLFPNCSSVGPFPGVQSFRNRLLQSGSPMGSQALPANLLQHGVSIGSQPPLDIHLLWHGVLPGLQVHLCFTVDLHGLQGDGLPHHGLLHGLQGNPAPGAPPPPPPSLTLVSAELFLSHILASRSGCNCCCTAAFSPSSTGCPRGATTITDGLGLGQWRVHHGANWRWLYLTRGSFLQLLTEATPVAPPATQILPCKPNTLNQKDNIRTREIVLCLSFSIAWLGRCPSPCGSSSSLFVAILASRNVFWHRGDARRK